MGSFPPWKYLKLFAFLVLGKMRCMPTQLGNLQKLIYMYISYFYVFNEGIPMKCSCQSNLTRLRIANICLTRIIPPELTSLSILDFLFLQTKNLVGPFSLKLKSCTCLKTFDVSSNRLFGKVYAKLTNSQELELLNLPQLSPWQLCFLHCGPSKSSSSCNMEKQLCEFNPPAPCSQWVVP